MFYLVLAALKGAVIEVMRDSWVSESSQEEESGEGESWHPGMNHMGAPFQKSLYLYHNSPFPAVINLDSY